MRRASAITSLACLLACSRSDVPKGPDPTPAIASGAVAHGGASHGEAVLDFVGGFDACALGHRGVLLDLGDPTMRAWMSVGGRVSGPDVETRERDGASWVRVHGRSLELSFVYPSDPRVDAGVVVEARMRGGLARRVSVYLNGKPVGALSLAKDESNIVAVRSTSAWLVRGANELTLRFASGSKSTHDVLGEIDWIRIGPNDGDAPYSAPTRADALTTATLGGVAKRVISLRAPGFVRCGGFVPRGAVLEGFLGVTGGEGEAEVRVLFDRADPFVAETFRLPASATPSWKPISIALGELGGLASIELAAKSSSKGARVVFAEPKVVSSVIGETRERPRARSVVVVVLGSAGRNSLSTYGGPIPVPELSSLANGGLVFESHRAASSFASPSVASLLTGLSPREHGIADPEGTLSPGVVTIAEAARQAGVVTGMFTANPTTTPPFGFARGWETFLVRPPQQEDAATAIVEDVARWITEHKADRFLALVHTRGGHPPWDASAEELNELPPAGYTGSLEPKHAGEVLAKARRSGVTRSFADADRERAFALHAKAIAAHDAALGQLVAHLRSIGRDRDTTLIVTADVGIDRAAHVPFLEDETLDEGALAVPLVVRGPEGGGSLRVSAPTTSVDIARTVLDALDLPPPPQMRGKSLWSLARPGTSIDRVALAATSNRFSVRWGGFVLSGVKDRETKLCNLSLEPECVSDVRSTHPFAAEILHGVLFDELATAGPPQTPTPRAAIDAPTTASLRAWGR